MRGMLVGPANAASELPWKSLSAKKRGEGSNMLWLA